MTAADSQPTDDDGSSAQGAVYQNWHIAFLVINVVALLFAGWTVASTSWGINLNGVGLVVPIAVAAVLVTLVGAPLVYWQVFGNQDDSGEDDGWGDELRERATDEDGDGQHEERDDDQGGGQSERGEVDRQTGQVESNGDDVPLNFDNADEDIAGAGNDHSPDGSDTRAGDTRSGVDTTGQVSGAATPASDDSSDAPSPTSESPADARDASESTGGSDSDKMRESDPLDLSRLPEDESDGEGKSGGEEDEATGNDLRDEVASKHHRRRLF